MYVREIKKNSKGNVLSSHAVICNKTLNWYTSKFYYMWGLDSIAAYK